MPDSRIRVWFAVFVLVVFCTGLAGGIVIGRRMGPPGARVGPPFGRIFGGDGEPQRQQRLIDRLSQELQLSSEQQTKVDAILSERRARLEQINRDVIARAEGERRDMQAEIRKVLTPEQQQRFDRWLAENPRGPFGRGRRGGYGPPR